jgi:hypothetical protein
MLYDELHFKKLLQQPVAERILDRLPMGGASNCDCFGTGP